MRRLSSLFLAVALIFPSSITSATGNISVVIDGVTQSYDQPPEIINGSTMVPLRGIFEALGATIDLDGKDITAKRGTTIVELTIGAATAKIDGKTVTLAQASQVINGRTLVPLRFVSEALGAVVDYKDGVVTISTGGVTLVYDVILEFPADRYPGTAAHILAAIAAGESAVCTIDRDGANDNRDESLKGIPTKTGYDRDEWPMAMCEEGGTGAHVAYVESSDNRGAGSWVGNALEDYPDGTRVLFVVVGTTDIIVETATPNTVSGGTESTPSTKPFASCAEARAAGATPLYAGDPGYSKKLDRDGDGVACE